MRMLLKRAAVFVLLRLQFAPFRPALRAFYALAIRAAVWRLRRMPGVEAVYLAGSLAGGDEVLWGVSDIDFVVFLRGRESDAVRQRIETRFAALRLLFPVLGADRRAVYFVDDFPVRHAEFPILQHLFDPAFCRYRLLHGRDVIADLALPALSAPERLESILWKMKYWMEKAILIVCSRRLTEVQQKYSLFKAMDDVAQLGRIQSTGGGAPAVAAAERGRALEEIRPQLKPAEAAVLEALLRERRERFRRRHTDLDALLDLFRALVARVVGAARDETGGVAAPDSAPVELADDPRAAAILQSLRAELGPVLELRRLAVPPITASITDCDGLDRPAYLLVPAAPLRIDALRRLKRYQEEELRDTAMLFVEAGAALIHAVSSEMMEHWLYTPRTEEHLWPGAARPQREGGVTRLAGLSPACRERLRAKLATNLRQIRRLFVAGELDLIHTAMHTRLVFTALQRLILARELDRADPALPASSAEVVAYLKTHTPVAPAFLDEVAAEHARALAGAGAGIHACFPKLHELVRVFLGALDRGESLERLAAVNDLPDRARLTISAVVITRNRCAYLSRCLEAMLRVDRAPDEILVVDNGSTDATREVVERWSAVRPIRYILEPALGVARARNAGSRAARGEILAFLDDDAVPTAGWLAALEHAFLKSRTIGIVGGAIHHFRNDRDDAVSTYYRLQEGPEPC